MTNRIILMYAVIAITFIDSCSFSNGNKCNQFRKGEFVYKYRGEQGNFDIFINRNDSIQIESNSQTGSIIKATIRWTDECTYELRLLESTYPQRDSIKQSSPLKNEILSSTKEFYIFKAKQDNSDFVLIDTMWVQMQKRD